MHRPACNPMKALRRAALLFLMPVLLAGPLVQAQEPFRPAISETPLRIVTASGTSVSFVTELALTPDEQAAGMMFRTELPGDRGMLFVFPTARRASFWMKNTLIPLDLIFIRRNGRIANIIASAAPETLTARASRGRVVAVFEIAGGRAAELGIKAGDQVLHPLLGSAANPAADSTGEPAP